MPVDGVHPHANAVLISAPLTRATYGLIGAAELGRMKEDAILVNLARGEIVQERPFDHLARHPRFTACIDAWWSGGVHRVRRALSL
jgi:phosphoglycerate dehydrogenase-like enzyme